MSINPFSTDVLPYSLCYAQKEQYLLQKLNMLVQWHMQRCAKYNLFVQAQQQQPPYCNLEEVPFLPVEIFKSFSLRSSTEKGRIVESSSTSGGHPSQIFVDEETGLLQRASAQMIFDDAIGKEQRPYVIFDAMQTAQGKERLSARGAAILGLMPYASQFFFVMDMFEGQLQLNIDKLIAAVKSIKKQGKPFIAYGFTYILFLAHKQMQQQGISFSEIAPSSCLLHSGGWKKLQEMAVSKEHLQEQITTVWGLAPQRVIDFYGFVEQVGVIYPECAFGLRHVPYYADILIRDPHTLQSQPPQQEGLIQAISLLPHSTPNHSVLTDDIGKLVSIDSCACGRKGRAFQFIARASKSTVRGCGNIYTTDDAL